MRGDGLGGESERGRREGQPKGNCLVCALQINFLFSFTFSRQASFASR